MDAYQPPEILATPLDQVILQLKTSFGLPSASILADVMDPPRLEAINASLAALHAMHFIQGPDDLAPVTDEGRLAASLGTDLAVAKMIVYGVKLGVLREAICVAAALAQQHSCFVRASHFVHKPLDLYQLLGNIVAGQDYFDAGLMSAPLMSVRILDWFRRGKRSHAQCYAKGLAYRRVSDLDRAARHLESKVRRALGNRAGDAGEGDGAGGCAEILERPAVVNKLRLAIFWAFGTKTVTLTHTSRPASNAVHVYAP